MGEMADDALDRLFDDYEDFEDGGDRAVTCNRCGEEDLHWETIDDERVVLSDEDGRPHRCKPDADGMEAV